MAFDLRAATSAARNEATSEPFRFTWGDEEFVIRPINDWPLEISAGFAELGDDAENQPPARVFDLMRQILGEDWERFAAVVPMDAIIVLMERLANDQAGVAMPDLSPPPEPVSTLT
jgi:hypothetical protein